MTARLTPAERAALTATAKSKAIPVASCVAARIPPAHIVGDMTRDELLALVIVLAEAVDTATLRAVVQAVDYDYTPADPAARQRVAHAEAVRLRAAHQPVPLVIRHLDSAYRLSRKHAARAAASQSAA